MKLKYLLGIFFLFLGTANTFAQESPFKTLVNGNTEAVFAKTIDYLQDNGYFILSVDKQIGFIQAKIFIKDKNLLSNKSGERRTINFMIRPADKGQSSIALNIYFEKLLLTDYSSEGIIDDPSIYKPILDGLQNALK